MNNNDRSELYQQVILEHNKKPKNYGELPHPTHKAEGYNPLCGDHLHIYLQVNKDNVIEQVNFTGDGCAISRASASMMTQSLKGKNVAEAATLFEEFHKLVTGQLDPDKEANQLGKLSIFSGIWHFPARVKCAILSWHTLKGALEKKKEMIKTE